MTGSISQWEKEAHLTPHGELPQPHTPSMFFLKTPLPLQICYRNPATGGTEMNKQNMLKIETESLHEESKMFFFSSSFFV